MPTVTINIAGPDTPTGDGPSKFGHMWYSLNDGKGNSTSYGFSPVKDGNPFNDPWGPGAVNAHGPDDSYYQGRELSRTIEITQAQYDAMKNFGDNPREGGFSTWYDGIDNSCIDFTWKALEKGGLNPAGFQGDLLPKDNMDDVDNIGKPTTPPGSTGGGDPFTGLPWPGSDPGGGTGGATGGGAGGSGGGGGAAGGAGGAGGGAGAGGTTPPRRDPLVLDLDGDGIETTSTRDGTVILFDHDADGVKTGTGWVKSDDGWLVMDRNGNGTIDSGRELFGVDTLKSNGQLAADGFDALKDQDANKDGKIDATDSVFANLRIWRDLNQDGISQANELSSLAANSITGIGVNSSAVNTDLGNGNVQTAAGSFTRSNGTTGTTGETNGAAANLDLLVNTFYRTFTTQSTLTDQAKALPTLRGSGRVRDLNEAISLSTDLGNWVQSYTQQTTRQGQIDKLDGFIEKWANTADLKSLKAQADALTGSGVKLTYSLAGLTAGTPAYDDFVRKLGVVERFMGFTYGGANGQARFTALDATSGNLTVSLAAEQIASISLAYDRFKTDIYESLVSGTRLKAYSKLLLEDSQGASKFAPLENAFKQAITLNPQQGIIDLVDFISSVGEARLAKSGWGSMGFLVTQLNAAPDLGAFTEELSSWTVRLAAATEHNLTGTSRPDLLVGTSTSDYLYGRDGNDVLVAKGGNDYLYGGAGNDTLDGGSGNDYLDGEAGRDIYLFGVGSGQDTLWSTGNQDSIQIKGGITPEDLTFTISQRDLLVSIGGTNDQLLVREWISVHDEDYRQPSSFLEIVFPDGQKMRRSDILARIFTGTTQDESIVATELSEKISGLAGNDSITAKAGDDTIVGGEGDDILDGGWGANTYIFKSGDGRDFIKSHVGANDRIIFDDAIDPSQIVLTWNELVLTPWTTAITADLVIQVGNVGDRIYVSDFMRHAGSVTTFATLKELQFKNETWDLEKILAKIRGAAPTEGGLILGGIGADSLSGTDNADRIHGGGGNDTLDGKGGNDKLFGGLGENTYYFRKGNGSDVILSTPPNQASIGKDTLVLEGLNPGDIRLSSYAYSGGAGSIRIELKENGEGIELEDFFARDLYSIRRSPVAEIVFADGTKWNYIQAMEALYSGSSEDDSIQWTPYFESVNVAVGGGNDKVSTSNGNDTLAGGFGDDTLFGGEGSNIFRYDLGDGNDTIILPSTDTLVASNAIHFGKNVLESDILIKIAPQGETPFYDPTALYLLNKKTAELVKVHNYKTYRGAIKPELEPTFSIVFDGGVVWDRRKIADVALASPLTGRLGSVWDDDIAAYNSFYGDYFAELYGVGGDDVLTGGLMNDSLFGGSGNDSLLGMAGNDVLRGNADDDSLEGGAGQDILYGGTGADTYIYNKGDGYDVIYGQRSEDSLRMTGLKSTDVTFNRQFSDINIGYAPSSTSYNIVSLVRQAFDGTHEFTGVSQIVFDDKTLTADEIRKEALKGMAGDDTNLRGYASNDSIAGAQGNDSLYGEGGSDTLNGGTGADRLEGGSGNDTYVFAAGDGADVIYDNDATSGNTDVISFTNVKSTDITSVVRNTADGLVLSRGASDSITIENYFTSAAYRIEKFMFSDGVTWTTATIDAIQSTGLIQLPVGGSTWTGQGTAEVVLGSSGIDSVSGLGGDDWLHGNAGNDVLRGGDGLDYLVGGLGNDVLYGDGGADTYVYAKGDGYDAIYGQRAEDTLIMKGFQSTEVTFNRQFSDISIGYAPSGTSYNIVSLVRQAFDGTHEFTGVNQIVFDDKTLTADEIRKEALKGTAGNDTNLRGYASSDTINGFDGNDSLYGEGGNDKLYGSVGNDLLDGGSGNDYLGGGLGNDTYFFSRGGGQDNIVDIDSTVGNIDILQFQSGIAHDQLWFSQSGNNLTISVIGTSDSVMIAGGGGGTNFRIEQLTAGGKNLSHTQVANLVQAMASMTPPAMGQTTLTDAQRAQLSPVLAANWN